MHSYCSDKIEAIGNECRRCNLKYLVSNDSLVTTVVENGFRPSASSLILPPPAPCQVLRRPQPFLTAYAQSADVDRPDLVPYNILIGALCIKGDLDAALRTVDLMVAHAISPDQTTCSALLRQQVTFRSGKNLGDDAGEQHRAQFEDLQRENALSVLRRQNTRSHRAHRPADV